MNKYFLALLALLLPLPLLAQGDNSLSFNPTAGDFSVVFLGNIFGMVDGVLHGNGGQIMGKMFGVFNAAVLALGGIIVMYTLLVSTMNTAHEGEFLGQKWSSIWVPTRATMGLALLIPKASGYCLMQVFVMWVVVQGVGAADRVWSEALGYLNTGGVLVVANSNPAESAVKGLANATSNPEVAKAGQSILAAQVCMLGLQKQLETQRQFYLDQIPNKTGYCYQVTNPEWMGFCNTPVPELLTTVNAVSFQSNHSGASEFNVPMPKIDTGPYAFLSGICGKLSWKAFELPPTVQDSVGISPADAETTAKSRAIAVQQVYNDLSSVAQVMVQNAPLIGNSQVRGNNTNKKDELFSEDAKDQFGVPLTVTGSPCSSSSDKACFSWGNVPGSKRPVILAGTEFLNAVSDYNAIMAPGLNLIRQAKSSQVAKSARSFIRKAEREGWVMAGSYFFDLVRLNQFSSASWGGTDSGTGLPATKASYEQLTSSFGQGGVSSCINGPYSLLCTWFNGDSSKMDAVSYLISGRTNPRQAEARFDMERKVVEGLNSSTVFGYVTNATIIQLPGQPGTDELSFANNLNITIDPNPYMMTTTKFDCGKVKITVFSFCLGRMLGNIFYNIIFVNMYNLFVGLIQPIINAMINVIFTIPLKGMAQIFQNGLKILSTPGINPVVALAQMGTFYINFSAQLSLLVMETSIAASMIPWFGIFIFAMFGIALPLILAWVATMVYIGFITAYYVPILPYMIFLFAVFGWLICVIEAMVAAPIVALGISNPEGHETLGKGEHALMILMNVFLRPSMMIIGYIGGIILTYVGVWMLNAGFDHAISFIQQTKTDPEPKSMSAQAKDAKAAIKSLFGKGGKSESYEKGKAASSGGANFQSSFGKGGDAAGAVGGGTAVVLDAFGAPKPVTTSAMTVEGGYVGWAGIFGFFFSILIYTQIYLTLVQKSFTLISVLPDKVLRWIGGQAENIGQETSGWTEETKQKVSEAGKSTQDAKGAMDKSMQGYATKGLGAAKGAKGGDGEIGGGK